MRPNGVKIFLLLFFLSFILRGGIALTYRFEGVYGQDPFLYLNLAKNLALSGENIVTIRAFPAQRSAAPMGYPLIIAGLYKIFGRHDIVAQLVSLVLGALTPAVAFVFFRRLFSLYNVAHARTAAIVAALFVALSPEHMRLSMIALADATGFFFVAAGMLAATAIAQKPAVARGGVFGACVALAVMTRYGNILIIVPALWIMFSFQKPKNVLRAGAAAALAAAICFAPQIASFLHVTSRWYYGGYLEGVSLQNFFTTVFRDFKGNDVEFVRYPNIVYYSLLGFGPGYATPFGAAAAAFGALKLSKNKILLLCLVWFAVFWIMICILPFQNGRFFLPAYMPVCIVAGIGLAEAIALIRAPFRKFAGTTVLIAGILVSVSLAEARAEKLADEEREERALVDWANECAGSGAVIFSCNVSTAFSHFTTANVHDLYVLDTLQLDSLASPPEKYMVIDTLDLQRRWRGFRVMENVAWLRSHYSVRPVFSTQHYTVFKF